MKHRVGRLLGAPSLAGPACSSAAAALLGLLLLGAAPAIAQPVRQVLLLQAVDRGNRTIDEFTGNFRVELDQRTERPVNVIQVVVGSTGFVQASDKAVVDYIRSAFIDRPQPDLVMAVGGPAVVFARKHQQQLFPDAPLLFAGVDRRYLGTIPLGDNEAAVAADNDFPGAIEALLKVLPQTRQVFMVMGAGQIGQFWHRELESQFDRFHGRLTFTWFDDLALPAILHRCASLPPNSAIFYVLFGTDAAGAAYADERVFADLHAAANAPIFAAHSVFFGAGAVGGPLLAIDDLSRDTADAAARILNGTPPRSIAVAPRAPGTPVYDWRELERWGIPENRLPPGSVVRYRAPSLWSGYRRAVLIAAAVLAVQSLLIGGLVYERRARRRAEIDSRRNLSLAADASRRETMSALTGSIAHELGQPLSSMMYNAQALQVMVTGNRATSDTIGEVLSDIQAQGLRATQIIERHRTMLRSRQLATKHIDLNVVIDESLALVAHEMDARQVNAAVQLSSTPCAINGDPVLLQQVIVNLVMNGLDALAGTPPAQRRLVISSGTRDADIELAVRDNGTGVAPDVIDTLFTPFVTTKAHGLGIGLTITKTIVDAHGGRITVRNNPDGGAAFVVTLPRRAPARIASGG